MERESRFEQQRVGAWLAQIETCWKAIPEFEVDPEKLAHLAIICDGNRRAAVEKGLNPWQGHRAGVEVIKGIMQASRDWGIKHLTFWTWSTENWKRDEGQVKFVMNLASKHLQDEELADQLVKEGVRFTHFGREDRLPERLMNAIASLEQRTSGNDEHFLNLALDYGGRDEAARATAQMMREALQGRLTPEQVMQDPGVMLEYYDTAGQPVPDLVIRTGGKRGEIAHTSGFMPQQCVYSGWIFVPDFFPDLTPETLCDSMAEFMGYERRFGR